MARTVKDAKLGTREARSKLAHNNGKPHYRLIEPGLHLGYRKPRGRRGKPAVAGKWVARHYVGAQAYIVETIATADDTANADGVKTLNFAQAQAKAREHMVKRARDANDSGPLTVKAAIEAYLAVDRKSNADARCRAEALILPTLGDILVESLTPDILRHWHASHAKTPPRVRTKAGHAQQHREVGSEDDRRRRKVSSNRTLAMLRAALNQAFRDGKTGSDAAWRKVRPFKDVNRARVRYLSIAEAQRLINASKPDFRALVQAALATGCRYGELCALRVADFNPDAGTLTIVSSKSGKPRHVVLTDEGTALFRRLCAGRGGGETVLLKDDRTLWGRAHQDARMRIACERARINPAANFHALRHTWASLSVMAGMPLMVVAKNLGHRDTRMVELHYGHLAPSYVADAVRTHAPRFGFAPDNIATLASRAR
jgi:integrase